MKSVGTVEMGRERHCGWIHRAFLPTAVDPLQVTNLSSEMLDSVVEQTKSLVGDQMSSDHF